MKDRVNEINEEIKRLREEKFKLEHARLITSEHYKKADEIMKEEFLLALQLRYHLKVEGR